MGKKQARSVRSRTTSPIIAIKKELKLFCNPPSRVFSTQSLRRKPFSKRSVSSAFGYRRRSSCPGGMKMDIDSTPTHNRTTPTYNQTPPTHKQTTPLPLDASRTLPTCVFTRCHTLPSGAAARTNKCRRSLLHSFEGTPPDRESVGTDCVRATSRPNRSWRSTRMTKVCDRAKLVSWEIASGIDAVKECGVSAGTHCCDAAVRAVQKSTTFCQQTTEMTDTKFQELKRSISSWSLSTFKKPKVSGSKKLKFPNLFSSKSRDRDASSKGELSYGPEDTLPKQNTRGTLQVIPHAFSQPSDQPEMEELCTSLVISEETICIGNSPKPIRCTEQSESQTTATKAHTNVPKLEDIQFIDEGSPTYYSKVSGRFASPVQYQGDDYSWNDTSSGVNGSQPHSLSSTDDPTGSLKRPSNIDTMSAINSSQLTTDLPSKGLEAVHSATEVPMIPLTRTKKTLRSCSELHLNTVGLKNKTKDQIVLNTDEANPKAKTTRKKSFLNMFKRESKSKRIDCIEEELAPSHDALTENIKKVFGIRRKLSIKPIIETNEEQVKNSEIHNASSPLALAGFCQIWKSAEKKTTNQIEDDHDSDDTRSFTPKSSKSHSRSQSYETTVVEYTDTKNDCSHNPSSGGELFPSRKSSNQNEVLSSNPKIQHEFVRPVRSSRETTPVNSSSKPTSPIKSNPVEFFTKKLKNIKDNVLAPEKEAKSTKTIQPEKNIEASKQSTLSTAYSAQHSRQNSGTPPIPEARKISDVKEAAINATVNNAVQLTSAKRNDECNAMVSDLYSKPHPRARVQAATKQDEQEREKSVPKEVTHNERAHASATEIRESVDENPKISVITVEASFTQDVGQGKPIYSEVHTPHYQNMIFTHTTNAESSDSTDRSSPNQDERDRLVISEPEDVPSIAKQLQANIRPSSLGPHPELRPRPTRRNKSNRYSCDEETMTRGTDPFSPYSQINNPGQEELTKSRETPYHNTTEVITNDNETRSANKSSVEPVYWEIGRTSSVPRPNPRKKKSDARPDLPVKSVSTLNLPRWIQQRPPMPSPRIKKQPSTQSLHCSKMSQHNFSSSHTNLFGASFANMSFNESDTCLKEEWCGEEFYSGKAASVAYGMTSARVPPPIPLRSKKPSLISLPGAIPDSRSVSKNHSFHQTAPKTTQKPIQIKRQRRKTAPVPPFNRPTQNVSSAVLGAVQDQLAYLTDLFGSGRQGASAKQKSDALLTETLYSVHSLMGHNSGNGTWIVPVETTTTSSEIVVGLNNITAHLQQAFQVTDTQFHDIWQGVQQKETADVTLFVKIVQAKGLRPKTVRGASNPFVIISLPSTRQSHRSRLEHETLNPTWNQEFSMRVKKLQNEYLNVEVWHEYHPVDAEQVTAVRNIRGLTRLVKETNATFTHKQEAHLLGSVKVQLSDLRQGMLNKWLDLQKEGSKDVQKERGSILIQINVGHPSDTSANTSRQSLDALLGRLVYHHIHTTTNNNKEEGVIRIPWTGQLVPEARAVFAQHSIIMGLNEAHQNLSWWIVGSRLPSSDTEWLHLRLKNVEEGIANQEYSQTELECFGESLFLWSRLAIQKLRSIQTSFPTSSGIVARHQLSYLLKTIMSIQDNSACKVLLEKRNVSEIRAQTKEAVLDHAKIWWTDLIDEQLRGARETEEQIKKIIYISNETFYFLSNVAVFYSPVLLTEASVPFFRESYVLLTHKLQPCVRPLLMNIFSKEPDERGREVVDPQFTLSAGSSLWQLYINLGRIYQLGQELPLDVREKSGLYDYHRWFTRGILRFLEHSRQKSQQMIAKAVQFDNFEPIDEYCNFSSSATDVTGIFLEIRIWWKNLSWPDPENSGVLLAKLLEDVCSCGIIYSDLLKNKVDIIYNNEGSPYNQIISKPICTGLNNIDRVRLELLSLPRQFAVEELSDKIMASSTGGSLAAQSFNANVHTLISNSSENMETKIAEFIETVIDKMSPVLSQAVQKACEDQCEDALLVQVLDPSLQLLKEKLNENNFICFIKKLWESMINIFRNIVNQNSTRRKASYFNVVCDIFEKTSKFFSPSVGAGLTREEAQSEEYLSLYELLNCLRLSSESLISKYYQERFDEQNTSSVTSNGELVVRAFFTKIGKLIVEVMMAKNIGLTNDSSSASSRNNGPGSGQFVDSYVKLQVLPCEWFPQIVERKTKTLRKSDPAVYEETFEFDLNQNDNGVLDGWILFTLKDYNMGRSNTFIGEAILSLKDLICVDSAYCHTIRNVFLKITMPGIECGYEALTALKLRPSDKVAAAFVKRVSSRFAESRSRKAQVYSSDEDKPKSRLHIRKLSRT